MLTEIFFDEAYERAAALDAEFKKTGKPTGPLHGLPISLKDDQDILGKRTTWGIIAWADMISDVDGAAAAMLRNAGAVFYIKTNVPSFLMTWESDNNLWGHCKNLSNLALGAGGSSGGEGLILSSGAAYIGIGSDIGGSIRIPAAVNGVYGLKPSARRFAHKSRGIAQGSPEIIAPVNGPLARCVDDLEIISRIWAEEGTKYEPEAIPMPWKEVTLPSKLKLGYFVDTDLLRVTPPVRRAMNEVFEKLKAAGHELVPFTIDEGDGTEFYTLAAQVFAAYDDNVFKLLEESGEPLIGGMEWITARKPPTTVGELWGYYVRRQALRVKYHARFLDAQIDGIICPVTGLPSTPHHLGGTNIQACVYTMMFNVLDYSAGVIPYTRVQSSDTIEPGFVPKDGLEAEMWKTYTPEAYINCPVSVQVVAKRLEEEKCLGLMKVVDGVING